VTGFEFLTDGTETSLFLKTTAGDLRGLFRTSEPIDAAVVVLIDPTEPGELLVSVLADDRPAQVGVAVYGLGLRDPKHPLECIHDALAAARFFDDFGIDRLAFVGSGVGGAAALAAGSSLETCRAVAAERVEQLPGLIGGGGRPRLLLDRDPGPELSWAGQTATVAGTQFRSDLQGWLLDALGPA
jgi:hypothetical protein